MQESGMVCPHTKNGGREATIRHYPGICTHDIDLYQANATALPLIHYWDRPDRQLPGLATASNKLLLFNEPAPYRPAGVATSFGDRIFIGRHLGFFQIGPFYLGNVIINFGANDIIFVLARFGPVFMR